VDGFINIVSHIIEWKPDSSETGMINGVVDAVLEASI
jgi:hypothetical protein